MRWTVTHDYRDVIDHKQVVLIGGSEVEMEEVEAARVNANSPGTLTPAATRAAVTKRNRQSSSEKDR